MKKDIFINQLNAYFDTYMPEVHNLSERTIVAYGDAFAVFFQFLDEKMNLPHHLVTYKQLTVALFDEFVLWMKNERGYSATSTRQRMSAITSFLKYASRREMSALGAFSAAKGTDVPKSVRTEFPYFTKEEMTILLSLPKPQEYLGNRNLVLLSFLYDTAARANELCKVCVGDVRFGTPTKVKLHGKLCKTREIPISDGVADLIRYHLNTQGLNSKTDRTKPLFSSQSHAQMTTSCIRSIVKKYVNLAQKGNPKLFNEIGYSPHSFRHSKAVHMVEAGVNLIYIRNFLGHATIDSTEIYARVGQEAVTKALTNRKIPSLAAKVPTVPKQQCSLPDCIVRARKIM
ncbi:MAG: site-specific integrase [Oscillospiraceae bacterium]|nr:site-specific integrase [Oscillospiraceae bacterium]